MKKIGIISTIAFLLIGLICGLIFIYFTGWSFTEFITNPTVLLITMIIAVVVVLCWTFK